jgi:hypothetical protein
MCILSRETETDDSPLTYPRAAAFCQRARDAFVCSCVALLILSFRYIEHNATGSRTRFAFCVFARVDYDARAFHWLLLTLQRVE